MNRLLRLLLCAGASVLIGAGTRAQDFPSRPVTLVVPFAAGSGFDATARTVGEELGKATWAFCRSRSIRHLTWI